MGIIPYLLTFIFLLIAYLSYLIIRSRVVQLSYQNRLFKALRSLDIVATSTVDIEPLSQGIVDVIRKELGYFFGVIALVDYQAQEIKRVAISADDQLEKFLAANLPVQFRDQRVSLNDKDNLFIKVFNERKGIFTENLYDIQKGILPPEVSVKIQTTFNLKGVFLYPIISKGKVIGIIEYPSTIPRSKVSSFEFTIMEEFTTEAARVLDNVMLYQNLKITTQQLGQANQKLKELDKLKDDFVSIASHELRTPMTAIRSYVWMALNKPDVSLTEKMKKYLNRTLLSTERLINLVNDMLNVSRIESGRIEIVPRVFDISALVKDVVEEVYPKAEEKKVKLVVLENKLNQVFADPDKVHQVLLNLVGNSLKFTPESGSITFSFNPTPNDLEISVKDTGVGIEKDSLSRLFQKFGRLDNSYVAIGTSGGTGLGLYISKSLIELMHGKIWASSEGEGKGATFSFTLPFATPQVLSEVEKYQIKPKGEVKELEPVAIY